MSEEPEVTAAEAGRAGCNIIIGIVLIILALSALGPIAGMLQLEELAEQNRIEIEQRGNSR